MFVDDVASSTACSRLHEPETVYDDVVASEKLTVGQIYKYYIYAYSRTSIVWAEDEDMTGSYESSILNTPMGTVLLHVVTESHLPSLCSFAGSEFAGSEFFWSRKTDERRGLHTCTRHNGQVEH